MWSLNNKGIYNKAKNFHGKNELTISGTLRNLFWAEKITEKYLIAKYDALVSLKTTQPFKMDIQIFNEFQSRNKN